MALQLAALRGVDVRLLVPRQSDHLFLLLAGRSYYDVLLQNGVRIFEYMPGILHAKMLVVDGHFTVIGSANADIRSMSYNFEVNVQIYGATFAQKAAAVFATDLEQSRETDAATYLKKTCVGASPRKCLPSTQSIFIVSSDFLSNHKKFIKSLCSLFSDQILPLPT